LAPLRANLSEMKPAAEQSRPRQGVSMRRNKIERIGSGDSQGNSDFSIPPMTKMAPEHSNRLYCNKEPQRDTLSRLFERKTNAIVGPTKILLAFNLTPRVHSQSLCKGSEEY
jgi:hypothetical protein